MPVTFKVSDTTPTESSWNRPEKMSVGDYVSQSRVTTKNKGKVLFSTEHSDTDKPALGNGFVGGAFKAYSNHYNLVFSPDTVWVAITTAFSIYIDKNAEELRDHFVNHKGKKKLNVYGDGSIKTANYDYIVSEFSKKIEENTKPNISQWLTANFSTTDQQAKLVSQIVMMGALKNYFEYKSWLTCGLPQVTLEGTIEDWQNIRQRIEFIRTFSKPKPPMMDQGEVVHSNVVCDNCDEYHIHGIRYKCKECDNYDLCHSCHSQYRQVIHNHHFTKMDKPLSSDGILNNWVDILGLVLDQFIMAFQGNIDTDFWNRIATKTGGGSGPTYLEGWILAFIPFTDDGSYNLRSPEIVRSTNKYGQVNTSDIPASTVEVPIHIDDNGTLYDTIFYAGVITYQRTSTTITPCLDWALIDVTEGRYGKEYELADTGGSY